MDIVFATVSAVASHPNSGASVPIVHGTHWPADDPVVVAYPDFFSTDGRFGLSSSRPIDNEGYPLGHTEQATAEPVEQATAAPGEKRTRTRAQ